MFNSHHRIFEWAGIAASVVLVTFGIVAIVLGINGRNTVQDEPRAGADRRHARHDAERDQDRGPEGRLPASIKLPTVAVAGKAINNGSRARAFATYMRIHALEATQGYTYAQMGQFTAKPGTPASQLAKGGGTSNPAFAVIDPKTKQPVANGARNVWVTETALTTALNTSYMAEQIALFGLVVGIALLLSGIGFGVLLLGGALRSRSEEVAAKKSPVARPVTAG